MFEVPQTRYVPVGDADVAYQVFGAGPDLLYFFGLGGHVELAWETPADARAFERLAAFARVISFDRRGTGASDGVPRSLLPTWEDWSEDLRAVLDAVGCERAVIAAEVDAGPIAIVFAALHPERVSSLVLSNTTARYLSAPDYPIGASEHDADAVVSLIAERWGTEEFVRLIAPALDFDSVRSVARCQRASATPRTAAAQFRYILGVDVREALPLIQAPTLVLHNEDNLFVSVSHGGYIADHIPGARLVTIPSHGDVSGAADYDRFIAEIAEFLTGERPEVEVDRILTTILFTDIVGSTDRLVSVGDRRWRELLDAHDRAIREQLRRFRGREINTTGDGFVASFDGPARAIRCAQAIGAATRALGIEIRAGLHTGECEVRGDDLGGLAVHMAARIGASAAGGEVLISGTVKDLVSGSGIVFADRGEHELKGVPGTWRLYAALTD